MSGKKKAAGSGKRDSEWPKVHVISELEQVKVLAVPLRLRILEPLCEEARTTKQVAEILGEKPTKLYHHVEALERAGLIRLETTRPKRGTLEKYYRAIARSFRADEQLFSLAEPTAGGEESWQTVAASVLENAAREVRRFDRAGDGPPPVAQQAIFAGLRIRAGEAQIAELRNKLESWIAEAQEAEDESGGTEDYRVALAFFPVTSGTR